MATEKLKVYQVVLLGGLVAGTLDIIAACLSAWLQAGVLPKRIFQSVAAGIYGTSSPQMGWKSAIIGLALHFFIATVWTAVFYAASRFITFHVTQPLISGVLYGGIVYSFMNFVVITLSAIQRRPTPPPISARLIQLSIIVLCIGIPIAFIVRKFSR